MKKCKLMLMDGKACVFLDAFGRCKERLCPNNIKKTWVLTDPKPSNPYEMAPNNVFKHLIAADNQIVELERTIRHLKSQLANLRTLYVTRRPC